MSARRRVTLLVAVVAAAAVAVVASGGPVVRRRLGRRDGDDSSASSAKVDRHSRSRSGSAPTPRRVTSAAAPSLYQRGDTTRAAAPLREARLARGQGRRGARRLARRLARPARAAREALSRGRGRPAPPRPRAALGERGRSRRGVASRARRRARHAVRDRRREPAAPEPPARPSRLHPVVRRTAGDHEAPAGTPARGAPRRSPSKVASANSCSTASVCSASGALSRPRASSSEAARRFPTDVEAQVAGAVGQFDKDAPERAFGRLGPLSRTHGDEPTVRFHLGVLLLWTGRIKAAERQFRLASRAQPGSALAREAGSLPRDDPEIALVNSLRRQALTTAAGATTV